jgi:predicted enzyme related to lactoylglutathione lyase
MSSLAEDRPSVFRPASVSYLRIPAPDPDALAAFYASVFGWTVDRDRAVPNFTDGSGHVIGHFVSDLAVAEGGAGVRPYVYVEDIDETLHFVVVGGGRVAVAPYPEGDLRVATFTDPAGNEIGIWTRAGA